MRLVDYTTFRQRLDLEFNNPKDSVTSQLVELTDLFQKISTIYKFAALKHESAFQNPIIFEIVQSALTYGVCVQIRRLADGRQTNEVSLFKIVQELKSQCARWTRHDFVTWDGSPYDPTPLRQAHEETEQKLVAQMVQSGRRGAYFPIGRHEEIERRHRLFDLLSNNTNPATRKLDDKWQAPVADYILGILETDSQKIVSFANRFLAHRITEQPRFDLSLDSVRTCIIALWKCVNVINDIFYDSYTTPDVINSLSTFDHLEFPLVAAAQMDNFIKTYEAVKGDLSAKLICMPQLGRLNFLRFAEAEPNELRRDHCQDQ